MKLEEFKNLQPMDVVVMENIGGEKKKVLILKNTDDEKVKSILTEDFITGTIVYDEYFGAFEAMRVFRDEYPERFEKMLKAQIFSIRNLYDRKIVYQHHEIPKVLRDDVKDVLWMMAKRGYRTFFVRGIDTHFQNEEAEMDYYTDFLHDAFREMFIGAREYQISDVLSNWEELA